MQEEGRKILRVGRFWLSKSGPPNPIFLPPKSSYRFFDARQYAGASTAR